MNIKDLLATIGDLEVTRRVLLQQLQEAQERLAEYEARDEQKARKVK